MKRTLQEILGVTRYEGRHLMRSPRLCMLLVMLAFLIHFYGNPVRAFCVSFTVKASPFPLFIGLTSTNFSQSLLYMLWIYLVCDSPFIDRAHNYVLLRCGRKNYTLGIMLYLLLCSFAYWIVVFLISILVMLGQLEPTVGWGRVYNSLARTQVSGVELTYLATIQKQLTALEAFALSFFLQVCCSFFLSLLVTIGNYLSKRIGVLLALAVIMFDMMFFWFGLPYFYMHFSPVTLANINTLDYLSISYHPSVQYALVALPVLDVAISIGCIALPRKQS